MIGYHYTSLECWESVQAEGLLPYAIHKPALVEAIGRERTDGVWVWQDRLENLSHIGSVLYQNATKNTLQVVHLQVEYDIDDCLSPPGKPDKLVLLPHTGWIGKLDYHDGSEKAVIVTKAIPPEQIKLLRTYNLLDAWKETECSKTTPK